jgi:hypothetical protein
MRGEIQRSCEGVARAVQVHDSDLTVRAIRGESACESSGRTEIGSASPNPSIKHYAESVAMLIVWVAAIWFGVILHLSSPLHEEGLSGHRIRSRQ